MTYSEEIEIIKTLLNFFNHLKKKRGQVGWQSRVAKMLGVSETWLSQLLTFDEQTPIEIKNLVKSGRLSINKAMDIMKLPERMREIKISDLMEEAKIKKRCKNPKDSIERIKIWIESGKELFKADMSLKSCEEIRDQFNDVIMPFYNHICQRLKNKTWR
jgi:DNA-binding transcriptional regulator YdaS (Cro superfamily)